MAKKEYINQHDETVLFTILQEGYDKAKELYPDEEIYNKVFDLESAWEYWNKCYIGLANLVAYRNVNKGMELIDLQHMAFTIMVHCVDKFDRMSGIRFSTYAVSRMTLDIKNYFYHYGVLGGTTRISDSKASKLQRYNEAVKAISNDTGYKATDDEIADYLGITVTEVHEIQAIAEIQIPVSTDRSDEYDTREHKGLVQAAMRITTNDVVCENRDFDEQIRRAVLFTKALTELEKKIIIMEYGLLDTEPHKLPQVAVILDMDVSEVRSMSRRAKNTLKKVLIDMGLTPDDFAA